MQTIQTMTDYQSRTPLDVKNPHWDNAEHTMLTADVLFKELEELGYTPFTTTLDADTKHGQQIWDAALNGDYGEIAEYEPPEGVPA